MLTSTWNNSRIAGAAIAALVWFGTLLSPALRGAEAKSLYVIADINQDPTPVQAYNLVGEELVLQGQHTVPNEANGAVGLAIDSASATLFVTYEDSNKIHLIDARRFRDLGTTEAPDADNLAGIVIDQSRSKLYAAQRATNLLFVYSWNSETRKLTLDKSIALPGVLNQPEYFSGMYGIALDEGHGILYVGDTTTTIHAFDTSTWEERSTVEVTQPAIGVAIDSQRNLLYAGNSTPDLGSNHVLCRVDLTTGESSEVSVGAVNNALGIAIDRDTGLVYVTTGDQWGEGDDQILVFDTHLNQVFQTGDIGNPTGLCIPDTDISLNPLNLRKDDGLAEDQSVSPGDEITYEICYDNQVNEADARRVILTDHVPEATTFVSATGEYRIGKSLVTWNLGTIPGGASEACQKLVVRVVGSSTHPGSVIENTATISGVLYGSRISTSQSTQTKVSDRLTHLIQADVNGDGAVDVLDYHLFAVPLLNVKSQNILRSDTYGQSVRAFQYLPASEGSSEGQYTEYPEIDPFHAGSGYWLITSTDIEAQLEGTPVLPLPGNALVVKLKPGPNLVGYPFLTPSDWASVRVRPEGSSSIDYPVVSDQNVWTEHVCFGYDQGYTRIDSSGMLQAWNACWVRNITDQVVELIFPAPYTGPSALTASPLAAKSSVQGRAPRETRCGMSFVLTDRKTGYRDRTLYLGLDAAGLPGPDPLDAMAPPPVSKAVPSIFVNHANWHKRPGRYAVDIRKSGIYPAKYPVVLQVPKRAAQASYLLEWSGSNTFASSLRIVLVDSGTGRAIDMRKQNRCIVTVPKGKTIYALRVELRP